MEELLDVLDADGKPTGARKPKSAVHRDGDRHCSVHVWIVRSDGTLLLQLRSASKMSYPSRWDVSAAGHVSAGETPVHAAIRETKEELGLDVGAADLHHVATLREQHVLHGGTWLENEIHEVFVVFRDVTTADLTIDTGEVERVEFVAPSDLAGYDPVPHPDQFAALFRFLER